MNYYSMDVEPIGKSVGELKAIAEKIQIIVNELQEETTNLDMHGNASVILRQKLQNAVSRIEDYKKQVGFGVEALNEILNLYLRTDQMLANTSEYQKSIKLVEAASEEVRELLHKYITENDFVNGRRGIGDETDAFDGDPVNMSTGNYVYQKAFLYCKGVFPLGFAIFYNGLRKEKSSLGRGWNHNYEITVRVEGVKVYVQMGDGRERVFVREKNGIFVGIDRGEKLEKAGNCYLYLNRNGLRFLFSENGTIESILDSHENGIRFKYDEYGQLCRAEVNEDAWLSYAYNKDGKLFCVEDHAGRKVILEYSDEKMSEMTDEGGFSWRYIYDQNGMLKSIINPEGNTELTNEYDEKGRVISQVLVDEAKLYYRYDDEHDRVGYVENNGNEITYVHDERYRNSEIIFSDGSIKTSYNGRGLKTSTTDKKGNETRYYYTSEGKISRIVNPLGEALNLTYNSQGLPVSVLVCGKRIFSNEYDKKGNLVLRRNALGGEIGIRYDALGKPVEIIQPDKSCIKLVYDRRGNIVKIENPWGGCTNYEYNDLGHVTAVINASGSRTDYQYDARGNILSITNAEGATKYYSYNSRNQLTKVQDFDGSVVRYRYNRTGKLAEVIDPDGGKTTIKYDDMRCVSEMILPNGAVRKKEYDQFSRLIREELPGGGTVLYSYDVNGNRTSVQGPDGVKTCIEYDALNRPVRFTGPDGLFATLKYNHLGQVIAYTDIRGNTEETIYDAAGQRTAFKDAAGNLTRYSYNEMGLLTEILTPAGLKETYEYEKGGRMVQRTSTIGLTEHFQYDAVGRIVSRVRDDGQELYYTYDILGRLQEVAGKDRAVIKRYKYDAVGRVISISDANDNTTKYGYTQSGHLKSVVDAVGNRTEYGYDALGQMISVWIEGSDEDWNLAHDLNSKGKVPYLQLRRNECGQVISIRDQLGAERHFVYDEAGRMVARTEEDGLTTRFVYNSLGQKETLRYSDGSEVNFVYDELRQLKEIRDWLGMTEISHDILGRISKVKDSMGNIISYQTGSRGERREIVYPDGRAVRYEYDGALRLIGVTVGEEEIRYRYGDNGKLSEKQYSNGFTESYQYEDGKIVSMQCRQTDKLLDSWIFGYDKGGRMISMDIERCGWPEVSGQYEYRYDVLNRLTEVLKNGESLRAYSYDCYGNRIRAMTEGGETFYKYDKANRLMQSVCGDHTTEYEYDLRGNVIGIRKNGDIEAEYNYSPANKLISSKIGDTYYRYNYNGLGDRIAEEQIGNVTGSNFRTDYIVDVTRKKRNLLQRIDESGTTDYLIDYNYTGEIGKKGIQIYGHDFMGSIISQIEEGHIGERYSYDEFGREKSLGGQTTLFGFAGYRREPGDMWNAGARQYDPSSARFCGRDIVNGFLSGPYSLNRYTYCYNQPISFVDTDGNWPSWNDVQNGLENLYCGSDQSMENLYRGAVNTVRQLPDFGEVVGFLDGRMHFSEGMEWAFEFYGNHQNPGIEEGIKNALGGMRAGIEYEFPWGKSASDYFNDFSRSELGESVLDRFDFWRDSDGVFHTRNKCWQITGGYNDLYDMVFEGATSAEPAKFIFEANGESYTIWSWKGDYINLGAGAETGIYRGDGYQVQCATDTGLIMSLALYNRETGELIFDYAPNDPGCWWVNGFNPDPSYQDMSKNDLLAVTEIDFRDNPSLWEAFLKNFKLKKILGRAKGWCIDESRMSARFLF